RALHERERVHRPAEPLLEAKLRDRDLPGRFVQLEVRERAMADAVRLDADTEPLELAELVLVHGRVEHAVRGEMLLVRQWLPVADVGERNELHRRIAVAVQYRRSIDEVVAVAV